MHIVRSKLIVTQIVYAIPGSLRGASNARSVADLFLLQDIEESFVRAVSVQEDVKRQGSEIHEKALLMMAAKRGR